jgi:hypothetical protein
MKQAGKVCLWNLTINEQMMYKTSAYHIFMMIVFLTSGLDVSKSIAQNIIKGSAVLNGVRVYTDSLGESHFEDLEIKLNEINFAPPAPPILTSDLDPATNYGFISVFPGWESDWHPTPKRQYVIYLSGTVEAQVSDGEIRRIGPGEISLVEDTHGKGHKSKVIGNDKVVAVIIQLED